MARRTTIQREADLELIGQLYIQGFTQREIADEIARVRDYDVSHVTVKNDLDAIQARWQESTTRNLDEHKAQELARIDQLEREYWSQYEASKEDYEAITKKAKDSGKDSKANEVTIRTETRTGDPRYLQGVERCIKLRMELLGLEAPKTVNNKHDGAIVILKTGMDLDEL